MPKQVTWEPRAESITVRLTPDEKEKLAACARRARRGISDYVRLALELDEPEKTS